MTITYQKNVSNTSFMGFAKLLFIWKGSIYKLVFKELLMYGSAYTIVSFFYRILMTESQKRQFEKVALYCDQTSGLLPMSFVLGFYVTFVVSRWWNQFLNLPWPDRVAHTVLMYVSGNDDRGRMIRRTLVRYVNLATIILFQTISGSAKKRFPTISHIVEAGLMSHEEKQLYDKIELNFNKHWVPLTWFINLIRAAVKEGRVTAGEPVKQLLDEVNNLRNKTGHLWGHDWVTVPLVYTQVVTLLTHLFFVTCLVGRQFLDPEQGYPGHQVDLYFPIYTFLQFFFFLGWLKVAEQLINPFGEDDDDFETNWFIDRNIQVSYAIVDDSYSYLAKLEKDPHWGLSAIELPYTAASLSHKIPNYKGSAMDIVPLGESYGRSECVYSEQYDNTNHRKSSTYSIFGDGYFNLLNRSGKRDSIGLQSNLGGNDVVITNLPGNGLKNVRRLSTASDPGNLATHAETTSLTVPNNNYARRHRPSTVAAHVLASVSEMDKEDSDPEDPPPSPPESVKITMAFLDEDFKDILSEKYH
ncbi:bestrophin-2a-like isoform X2 [Parasteatoda tepidariorum]|uniref:bestrophin-2a-like isoform X2 n=1 Tax=Parasteatoda tepidariorum TaxID=114398 RepID=UPI001C728D09|nr:bestrophin-2-like isoform X2 [Parasteatoda tepidariorum]